MKKLIIVITLFFLLDTQAFSQDIEIVNIYLNNGLVEIQYNLKDERIDRRYSINLYNSKDNFIQPMEFVSGDVGINIAVGEKKKLIWDAKKELGDNYTGKLSVELKGNYYIPFVNIEGITSSSEFKRGSKQDFVWSGGRGDNVLKFELYRDENLVTTFKERPNTGETELHFPSNIPPGDNYRIKISDKNNRDEIVFTEYFTIKRKYPLSYQIIAGTLAVAAVVLLVDALIPEPEFEIGTAPDPNQTR